MTVWRLDWREMKPGVSRTFPGDTGTEWFDTHPEATHRAHYLCGKGWETYVYPVQLWEAS